MLTKWFNDWWTKLYFFLLRPMFKWIVRHITGKCELLRITYNERNEAERARKVEISLRESRHAELKKCAASIDFIVSDSAKTIAAIKNIVPEVHAHFEQSLYDCLLRIRAYNKIHAEAEGLRMQRFTRENHQHEAKLTQLWDAYNDTPLPQQVGQHWIGMGFQGPDPSTDFRGMGMLGLEQLIYFGTTYPSESRQVLSQSHHPQFGFSFAIVGINITEMGYSFLHKRKLKAYFYSMDKLEPNLVDFHQVYCYLLYNFAQFWISEEPRDIMEFGQVRKKFYRKMKQTLQEPWQIRLLPITDNPIFPDMSQSQTS